MKAEREQKNGGRETNTSTLTFFLYFQSLAWYVLEVWYVPMYLPATISALETFH
jgi:hypothetical protein